MHTPPPRPLEDRLKAVLERADKEPIFVSTLLSMLSGKGLPVLVIFISLPFCQPIQIPGFSTPFGILVAFLGLRMSFGHKVWLPQSIKDKKLSHALIKKITTHAIWLIKKIKRFSYPRMTWLSTHPLGHIVNGVLIFVLGLLLALPLPIPFTNLLCGWSLLLVSFGILEDDGLLLSIGYLLSLLCVLFFVSICLAVNKTVST